MGNRSYEIETIIPYIPSLIYVSYSKYENDWKSIMHTHSATELLFITQGNGWLKTVNGEFPLITNSFVFIPPNMEHTEQSSETDPLEYYVLGISNITLLDEDYQRVSPVLEMGSSTEEIKEIFLSIYREIQNKRNSFELMAISHLLRLSTILSRRKKIKLEYATLHNLRYDLAPAKSFIDFNYAEQITLDEIVEQTNMSKYHFVREFSKAMGMTPMKYLAIRRIEETKKLLSSTSMSISEISQSVGFSSPSYFAQKFKSTMGMSPMEFKNTPKKTIITEYNI